MLRRKLHENMNNFSDNVNPKEIYELDEKRESLSEWKIGLFGLLISLFVLTAKILHASRQDLYTLVFEKKLLTYDTITEDGQVMFTHVWKTALKFSSIWLPPLCGFLITYFTGLIVYLDSSVPGVQPPSPFSPTKYKVQSGHTFHLNYVIAVAMGVLVTSYMYWRQVSIEF